jgi:hypothetical protein
VSIVGGSRDSGKSEPVDLALLVTFLDFRYAELTLCLFSLTVMAK